MAGDVPSWVESVRQGFDKIGQGVEGIARGLEALAGRLPAAGAVPADSDENYSEESRRGKRRSGEGSGKYNPIPDLRSLIEDYLPGTILIDGTSLSQSGDKPITLISGDPLSATRIREIMITLQIVDTVAPDSDGTSPLRAIYDVAQMGGRVQISAINRHDVDVLERYQLGKISSNLGWSDVLPLLPIQVPYQRQSFVLDPDVVSVARSGLMLEGDTQLGLRNPERPERDESLDKIGEVINRIARLHEKELPADQVLFDLIKPRLSKTGSDMITLRNWRESLLLARGEGEPYERKTPTDSEVHAIQQRFGSLCDRLSADSIRSVALRLELLISRAPQFEELYNHVSNGTTLSNSTALLLESYGLGTAFYRGSSGSNTELGIQFKKGVVEVLLAGACWFPNQDGGFLGLFNPEKQNFSS